MDTVAQKLPIPYDFDHEPEAAYAVAAALVRLGLHAYSEYMGFGTPVVVPIGDETLLFFQGWGEDDGWYASRQYLDITGEWQPDENEESTITIPELAGNTDPEAIASAINDAVIARYYPE